MTRTQPRARRAQVRDQGRRLDHLLEVVQRQGPPVLERLRQPHRQGSVARVGDPERRGDGPGDQRGVRHRGQRHEPEAAGERRRQRRRGCQGEARLAHAAGAREPGAPATLTHVAPAARGWATRTVPLEPGATGVLLAGDAGRGRRARPPGTRPRGLTVSGSGSPGVGWV